MNLSEIFKEALLEAKKKKPSAGLTKKQKSDVAKKAKKGEDIGKKGKGFEKIAAKAEKKYGSEEKGKKVAAAAMWKNIKRVKEGGVDEVTPNDWAGGMIQRIYNKNKNQEVINAINSGLKIDYYKDFDKALRYAGKEEINKTIKNLKPYIDKIKNYLDTGEVNYIQKHSDKLKTIDEGEDHEVSMAKNSLESIMKSVADLMQKLGNKERNIPGWIQDHISNAENFIDQAAQGFHELEYHGDDEEEDEEEEGSPMIQPVDEDKYNNSIRYDSVYNTLNANRPTQKDNTGQKMALELSKKYTPIKSDDMPLDKYLASQGLVIVDKKYVESIDEKKLTKAEKAKKEEIINAIAKEKGGKKNLNGKDYAIATKQSIQSAE